MGDESIRILGSVPMYCTQCDEVTECLAIPPELLRYPTAPRKYHRDYPGIRWYRRIRLGLKCKHKFMTAEVEEEKLVNLISLAVQRWDTAHITECFKEAVTAQEDE
jgi:hypothetical protein